MFDAKNHGVSLLDKLFLSFCLRFPLIAARAAYRFDSWTADDGLPQNMVCFPSEAEMSVYRIVQESLSNVFKHSEADKEAIDN